MIVIYILMILILGYIAVFYASPVFAFLLAVWVLIFPLSLLLSWWVARSVKVTLEVSDPLPRVGEEIRIRVRIQNRLFLPASLVRLFLRAENGFWGEEWSSSLHLGAGAFREDHAETTLLCPRAGRLTISVSQAYLRDFLHFSYVKVKKCLPQVIHVLPQEYSVRWRGDNDAASMHPLSGEGVDPTSKGPDPDELFQIRSYQPGDRPQSIHWKLSSRTEDLLAKEFVRNAQASPALLMDLSEAGEGKAEDLNKMLSASVSLALARVRSGKPLSLAWRISSGQTVDPIRLHSEENLYEILKQVYAEGLPKSEGTMEEYIRDAAPDLDPLIRIDAKMNIYRNGELMTRLDGEPL